MMRQIVLAGVALAFASQQVHAQLDELIEQNIRDAEKSYEKSLNVGEQRTETPRVWLHVRSDSQKQVAQEILNSLKEDKLHGRSIELKPVRTVDFGPDESQLRYFKQVDEEEVQVLLELLKKLIPGLVLRDLSKQYAQAGWIKPGHYELWLSPDLLQVAPPE